MSRLMQIPFSVLLLLSCALMTTAHGGSRHEQIVVAEDADWATRHMAEEHHINSFDSTTFFTLHDYDSTGLWTSSDISRTYGLNDPSTKDVPELKKKGVVDTILKLFDVDGDGSITLDEFNTKWAAGERLPDFGLGPGHHGDDEYEYEIHHWEKYHSGDDVKEEDLNHPEDIEHFRMHEEQERKKEEWERLEKEGIVVKNIPAKYRIN